MLFKSKIIQFGKPIKIVPTFNRKAPLLLRQNADQYIPVTEWEEFKKLKPETFTKNTKQPIHIDGRRIYNPEEFNQKPKFTAIVLEPSNSRIE